MDWVQNHWFSFVYERPHRLFECIWLAAGCQKDSSVAAGALKTDLLAVVLVSTLHRLTLRRSSTAFQ